MSVPMNGAIKVNSLMSPVTGDLGPAAVTAGHLMSSMSFRKQLSVTKHLYSNLLPLKVKKNILEDKLLKRVLQNHYAVYTVEYIC